MAAMLPRVRRPGRAGLAGSRQGGFTLVELIVVALLLGILSFAALAPLRNTAQFDARGFADQAAATIRLAQKLAVAQRQPVYVNVSAATPKVWACLDAATNCAQPLPAPSGGTLSVKGPSDVTLTTGVTQLYFDALGQPSTATTTTIVVAGGGASLSIFIEPVTGYVHRS